MRFLRKHYKLVALAAACVALGAGVSAISVAGAATSASGTTPTASSAVTKRHHGLRGRLLGAVQGSLVVHTKSGFATVTFNRGVVDSVSGQQLTLTERTKAAVYRTVTLTIPTNARVRDNGRRATLMSLTSGQRVLVVTAPAGTLVAAHTPRP